MGRLRDCAILKACYGNVSQTSVKVCTIVMLHSICKLLVSFVFWSWENNSQKPYPSVLRNLKSVASSGGGITVYKKISNFHEDSKIVTYLSKSLN